MSSYLSRVLLALFLLLAITSVQADDGLVNERSQYDVKQTLDRFEEARANTISLINRIKQSRKFLDTQFSEERLMEAKQKIGQNLIEQEQMARKKLPAT